MPPKKKRLTTSEFSRFFASGRRFHSPSLTLVFSPHPHTHNAVVVGKKVYKKAVDRNRLRRQIYHLLYSHTKALSGVFIVTTKPNAKNTSQTDLKTEISSLVDQTQKKR